MFAGFITASVSLIVHFYYVLPLIQKGDDATFSHLLAVHIFGWIAQFIGHGVFEGRKPALMDNLLQGKPRDSSVLFFKAYFKYSLPHCSLQWKYCSCLATVLNLKLLARKKFFEKCRRRNKSQLITARNLHQCSKSLHS